MTDPSRGPALDKALEKYRRLARRYDRQLAPADRLLQRYRRAAVRRLHLSPGATVLDVGCGTGASLPCLVDGVGIDGRVVGIEPSADMLAVARERVRTRGWGNVTLVQAAAESVGDLPPADGALLFLTHDLYRSGPAVRNLLRLVRPGGSVVAAGAKRGPRWAGPFNALWLRNMRRYVTTLEGVERPWNQLEEHLTGFEVTEVALGFFFIASGRTRG